MRVTKYTIFLATIIGLGLITGCTNKPPMITQIGADPSSEHMPGLDTTSNVPDTVNNMHDTVDNETPPPPKKKPRVKKTTDEQSAVTPANPASPTAQLAPAQAAPTIQAHNNWQPNEVVIMRGGELIKGLKRELGRQPSESEMQTRLQTHMGLSAIQAKVVIEKLG